MSANINGLLTRPPLHVKPWWCLKGEVDFNCIDNRKIDMGSIYMSRRRWYFSQIKDRPYAVPYRLHKIPKEEKVRLKWQWARPLNRNDLPKNVFVFHWISLTGDHPHEIQHSVRKRQVYNFTENCIAAER